MRREQINILFLIQMFFLTSILMAQTLNDEDTTIDIILAQSTSVPDAPDSIAPSDTLFSDSTVLASTEIEQQNVLVDTMALIVEQDTVSPAASAPEPAAVSVVLDSTKNEGVVKENLVKRSVAAKLGDISSRSASNWVISHLFHLIFLFVSLAIILSTVLFYLKRKDSRRFLTTTRLSVFDKVVQRTCRHIETNYADPLLTVESICQDLVTGEAFLEALFEKELGISIRDFIDQVRVNSLKILLTDNPGVNAAEAILQCGFIDKAAAEETFRRITGVSLDEFSKSLVCEE